MTLLTILAFIMAALAIIIAGLAAWAVFDAIHQGRMLDNEPGP